MRISDWSSDVCSSDLRLRIGGFRAGGRKGEEHRSADAAEQSEGARADDRERGEEKHKPERAEREIEARDEARIGHEDAGALRRDGRGERGEDCDRGGLHHEAGYLEHDRGDRSEEHTSELQSLMRISYAVFCLKKKINNN